MGLLSCKDCPGFGSTSFVYFASQPSHVELCRDARFDL